MEERGNWCAGPLGKRTYSDQSAHSDWRVLNRTGREGMLGLARDNVLTKRCRTVSILGADALQWSPRPSCRLAQKAGVKGDVMWVYVVRQPRPDATYWVGRRWFAAVDAVAWPAAWIAAVHGVPAPTGVFGPFGTAVCVLAALSRLHRAVCENNRYWFTTWRWGRVAFAVWLAGVVMKLTLPA